MQTVAIVGLGLIGGSFGLALRKAGFTGDLLGVSEPAYASIALEIGAITKISTLDEICRQADLIYLAQPVAGILKTLEEIGPHARQECLITDAGSTKRVICEQAIRTVRNASFLGGHPMAGKEKRGIQQAEQDLFNGRTYVLTRISECQPKGEETLKFWLERMGASILFMTPDEHDEVVAYTSHLPQLLSTTLANTVCSQSEKQLPTVFGTGLLDMTRLAVSSADLWTSILETNHDKVSEAIEAFEEELLLLKQSLQQKKFQSNLNRASMFAERLRNSLYKN